MFSLSLSLSLSLTQINELTAKFLEDNQREQHSQIIQHTSDDVDSNNIMLKNKDELTVVSNTITEIAAKGSTVNAASQKYQLCAKAKKFSSTPSDLETNLISLSEEVKLSLAHPHVQLRQQRPPYLKTFDFTMA